MALCCVIRTEKCIGYILCGQNTKFLSTTVGVTYSYHSALIDWIQLLKIQIFLLSDSIMLLEVQLQYVHHTAHSQKMFSL
jgi:hypothetical protein